MFYKSVEYLAFKGLIILQNASTKKIAKTFSRVLMQHLILLVFKLTNFAVDVEL
jgi:hypothetical protein